ncbi:hypothetical protein POM88_000048 [Heracleum sosnowskyi]|uniref:Uncharacterized protein n=1 Tax=Heracleum sosnowskyi TaxID=360622 RepID=A0AAD8NAG1_9APIA|nr:hypothetical protein POM88_000048 [Heracleum sosnowskyi]
MHTDRKERNRRIEKSNQKGQPPPPPPRQKFINKEDSPCEFLFLAPQPPVPTSVQPPSPEHHHSAVLSVATAVFPAVRRRCAATACSCQFLSSSSEILNSWAGTISRARIRSNRICDGLKNYQ